MKTNKLWAINIGEVKLWVIAGSLLSAVKKAERVIKKEYHPRTIIKGVKFRGTIDAF